MNEEIKNTTCIRGVNYTKLCTLGVNWTKNSLWCTRISAIIEGSNFNFFSNEKDIFWEDVFSSEGTLLNEQVNNNMCQSPCVEEKV